MDEEALQAKNIRSVVDRALADSNPTKQLKLHPSVEVKKPSQIISNCLVLDTLGFIKETLFNNVRLFLSLYFAYPISRTFS